MSDYKEYINKNCKIIPFDCRGTIIGVYITGKGIEFQVRYYMNGEQKTDYFFEWEILTESGE